jgi:WXG100 family type VII secretion target
MDHLSFDPGGMDEGMRVLGEARGEIGRILSSLQSHAGRLRDGWTGQASDAYAGAQLRWVADLYELNAVLAAAAQVVGESRSLYESTEAANASRWG